ncbi:Fanconi anemia group C protein isoform X1 [Seriola lalandi dorsalis]|uniref:FA complementation group C n=1 Tax=Seriola lalandi dorsalis TaxID=1841481 RepID=A0A3B4YMY2_SERLL|nr:Fanconi anemia group C protein isoform X1 [Seriola lalandi dorsalis]XP_023249312.1 Fanconi anemia group C protein isoform X1 [Seriola lalandi dorsalis]XP_023249313.1 Fanconi anemia group C protein isoform X1 [Seriola lalandi dorsalis]XP_023249314.1 Fanconi anemia group C protein isoform X1 [Seriola lalandi dorsalis]
MSQLQPLIQLQQTTEPLLNVQEMQFWLDKAVAWGQADSPKTQKDTGLHLSRLSSYLQHLLTHINNTSSTTETMKRLPYLGQFLGRLCWNPYVTADDTSRRLLLQCLFGLYSEHPSSAVERKANQWIRKVLCQLATEEDDAAAQALMKCVGVPPKEYHLKVLRKMVASLQENIGKSCNSLGNINQRCSCDSVLATSEACVPLVTCPEAAPLIGALLQRPVTCVRAALSEDFLDALSSAYSSQGLSLEEQAVVSLWYHSLSSLEEAVLSLLESVLPPNTGSTPLTLEQQVAQSLLPKACAQHCSIFLVVNEIFRSVLKQAEGNECVKSLIQTFTSFFLKEVVLLQPQKCVSLKTFFPQSPQSLLLPLLTLPSEMPQEAWRHHLNWLSSSLQRLTEEEEEGDGSSGTRGHHKVFEAWFLLVQCAHWVQVTVQLLGTSGHEDCGPLLWLLTFYHHPTNRGHHRALQLVHVREAWDHLRSLFLDLTHPLSVDHLQSMVTLLSPHPQQPSPFPLLILSLLVSFAVFSQQSLSGSTQILQTVVDQSGLVDEAACVLDSLELRLKEGSCLSSVTNRVHLRIKALQNTLTHMHAA